MMKHLSMLILLLFQLTAYGIQMMPMEAEIVIGQNKMVEFTLKNSLSYPVAMKAAIYERTPNIFGLEGKYIEANDKLFEVIKPNIILMAKGDKSGRDKKTIRVYYKGSLDMAHEHAFRIIVQQMPVDLDKKNKSKNKVRFLAKFVGALYVTPPKAKPNLILSDIKLDKNTINFKVENQGQRRDFIEGLKITVKGIDKKNQVVTKEFKGEELKNIYHHTILSKKTRQFSFEIPQNTFNQPIKANDIQVSL